MSTPIKPCDGAFSDDLQELLTRNRNREQWAVHTCQVCGASVGAAIVHGKWVPEQHWPSVKYAPRVTISKRYERSGTRNEDAVTAMSARS